MELRHLRYFVAVAETRHFNRAAERLHMAQPPLSQAIRQLEAELGVELLTRTTRHVALTPAGEVLYVDAVRILAEVADSTVRMRHFAEGRSGVLRLGLTGVAAYTLLPRVARVVERELPGVVLELTTELLTPTQERALVDRRLDLGALRPPVREPGVSWRTVSREPLVLVLPRSHRLAGRAVVELSELADEPFVTYPRSAHSVVDDAIARSCHAAGFSPRRAREAAETTTLLALVAAGIGVALVPASVQSLRLEGITHATVPGTETVALALAWRTDDTSPLLARLLAALEADGLFLTDDDPEAAA